jgi:hypothetical protein
MVRRHSIGPALSQTACALEPSGDEYALMQSAALELFIAIVVAYKQQRPTRVKFDEVHAFLVNAAPHLARLVSSSLEPLRRRAIELITAAAAAAVDIDAISSPVLIASLLSMAALPTDSELFHDGIQLLSLLSLTSDGARNTVLKSALPLLDRLLHQKDGAVHSMAVRLLRALRGWSHKGLSFADAETIAPMLTCLKGDPSRETDASPAQVTRRRLAVVAGPQ